MPIYFSEDDADFIEASRDLVPRLARALLEERRRKLKIGRWLSAALEDPKVCEEMKRDIREWLG